MDTTYCLGTDRDAAGSAGQAGAPGFGTAQDERDASRTPPQTLSVQERRALIFEAAVTREAAERRLIDDLLGLFGGRSRPIMAHLIESGTLTLEDVREAEKALLKFGKEDKSKEKSK